MPVITIDSKTDFAVIELGAAYDLPTYTVVPGKGIEPTLDGQLIQFVRGSKKSGEGAEKNDGIVHETLISMMIFDLKHKNSEVPSKETAMTITKLEEALMWQQKRHVDRATREVLGTYQK